MLMSSTKFSITVLRKMIHSSNIVCTFHLHRLGEENLETNFKQCRHFYNSFKTDQHGSKIFNYFSVTITDIKLIILET